MGIIGKLSLKGEAADGSGTTQGLYDNILAHAAGLIRSRIWKHAEILDDEIEKWPFTIKADLFDRSKLNASRFFS